MKKTLLFAAIACLAGPVLGADAMMMNKDEMKWGDGPPGLPKGAKLAVLYGDPGKAGPFTVRFQMPPGYKIAPHWHSKDESLTILSGTMYMGLGEKVSRSSAHALKPGGYHFLPAKTNHYVYTGKSQAVIQVSGEGPFDVNWVNPADDPQKIVAKPKGKM
jgi:quercetin dioxygenase-like cupin family protein